jgi:alpha-amylase/alpha-mannosidase (GH57 family)
MVAILDNYPNVKVNINLVPSLLLQLEEYASGMAKDKFLILTLKSAQKLNSEDKIFILKNFFMANFDNMIAPYPRYLQILNKRGREIPENEIKNKLEIFSTEEFRDLQVWFNLAWFDPYWKKNDDFIKFLHDKKENFTEEEKAKLIEKQLSICGKVIKKHKEAQDRGQIEITTTPFYHPILPLLCDTNSARQATPSMVLPNSRFSHPEDARWHIENAVDYYEKLFGRKPLGMWPSEGSVSNAAVSLISQAGIKWIATDETILFNGMKDISSSGDRKNLFKSFKISINGQDVRAIFRDHGLSDSIGFVYYKWQTQDAVNDFISKIKNIGNYMSNESLAPLVSVILDGENCWEYYKNDGWDFLEALYEKLNSDDTIETVKVGEYIEKFAPESTITNLTSGSWISGNFGIWIGHKEDNVSWDYLGMTRDFLTNFLEKNPHMKGTNNEKEAWNSLYCAEGSDWNWWYGDDNCSENDAVFDFIYRQHLIKVYECFGAKAPDILYIPIKKLKNRPTQKLDIKPCGFIKPKISVSVSDMDDWKKAGYYEQDFVGGSMHQTSILIRSLNYGFDEHNLYFRLNLSNNIESNPIEDYCFKINLFKPIKNTLCLKFNVEGRVDRFWIISDGKEHNLNFGNITFNTNLILFVPLQDLELQTFEGIEFNISIDSKNCELEKLPRISNIKLEKFD